MALGVHRAADIDRALSMYAAYGNVAHKSVTIVVPATAVNGDTVDFMKLHRNCKILDCILRNTGDTNGATTTIAVGIAQIPNKASTKVDVDALITATTLTTGNQLLSRNNAAVGAVALTLDDDYLIQGAIAAADIGTNAVTFDLTVFYEALGTP